MKAGQAGQAMSAWSRQRSEDEGKLLEKRRSHPSTEATYSRRTMSIRAPGAAAPRGEDEDSDDDWDDGNFSEDWGGDSRGLDGGMFDEDEIAGGDPLRSPRRMGSMFGARSHMDLLASVMAEEPAMKLDVLGTRLEADDVLSLRPRSSHLDRVIAEALADMAAGLPIRARPCSPTTASSSSSSEDRALREGEGSSSPPRGADSANLSGEEAPAAAPACVKPGLRKRLSGILGGSARSPQGSREDLTQGPREAHPGRAEPPIQRLAHIPRARRLRESQGQQQETRTEDSPGLVANPRSLLEWRRERSCSITSSITPGSQFLSDPTPS